MDEKTFREAIRDILHSDADLDKPLMVRIVKRDKGGSVVSAKEVPVYYIQSLHGYPIIEQSVIDQAEEKGPS